MKAIFIITNYQEMKQKIYNYNNLFNFYVNYSDKRTKTIQIRIIENQIYVYAPIKSDIYYIYSLLDKNKEYLLNKIVNTQITNLNELSFLGKKYKIIVIDNKLLVKPSVDLMVNEIIIYKPLNKEININNLLLNWKKNECYKLIYKRVKMFCLLYNFNFNIKKNKICIKAQKTKWGSCSSLKNLNFNYRIIEKRLDIIDYLIVHELSHTVYMNHSKQFWNYIQNIIPNYKILQKELKN